MRKWLAGLVLFGWVGMAGAEVGWLESFVYVWPGADPNVWYDLNGSTQGQNFHNADLGDYPIAGSLFLNSQLNAWANGDDYYTDTSFSLFYRVYETGDSPPAWSSSQSVSISHLGGDDWRGITPGVNILNGLTAGNYSVDVFAYKIHYFDSGNQSWEERIWEGGVDNQPFTAEFQVIPEPGTLGLLGLGLASLAGIRRRRR